MLHLSTSNSVIEFLQKQLRDGGCAAVICNTVKRAQDMAEIIRAAKIVDSEEVILFHARFPFQWRNEIERSILERFGKDGKRPNRSIVVATQVIEQSLDLDFDVIVSEIAPIDLIIQRAGRLHRHNRDDRRSSIAQPVFALIMPDMKDGSPNFGSNKYVYEEYLLLRSYVILERKTQLYIPDDTQELIEGAYGDKALENITIEMQSRINKAYHEMVQDRQSSISHARQRLVLPASDEELLTRQNLNLEEDNEQINKDLQALTREGDPGVNLICLFRHQDSRLYLDPEIEDTPISLDIPPTKATIKNLLANSLKLQTPHSVVLHLSSLTVPEPWSEVAALRHHHPIIFEHHRSLIQKLSVSLVLTREMGLFVEQEAI